MSFFRRRKRLLGPGSSRIFYVLGFAALLNVFAGDLFGLRVHAGEGHIDPVGPILMGLVIILLAAKVAGDLFERFKQPAVLGELIVGMVLGNVGAAVHWDLMQALREGTVVSNIAHEVLDGTSLSRSDWDKIGESAKEVRQVDEKIDAKRAEIKAKKDEIQARIDQFAAAGTPQADAEKELERLRAELGALRKAFENLGRERDEKLAQQAGPIWMEAARHHLPPSAFNDQKTGAGDRLVEKLSGSHGPALLLTAEAIDIFSRVGVIILLFMVGLESNIREMAKVGMTAFLVAVVGVVAPFVLGYLVSQAIVPGPWIVATGIDAWKVHVFSGATLCATSVGITARVLKDMGKLDIKEAKIILGAAVIDDVIGLIILAVVLGLVSPTAVITGWGVSWIIIKAVLFLVGALVLGVYLTPVLMRVISKMRVAGMKLIYSLVFCFLLSWAANMIDLATIVGAFAAGLILEEVHFKDFRGRQMELERLVDPIAQFLVPVFFVLMGIQVKYEALTGSSTVILVGLALTAAAWIGKQACMLACDKGTDRLTVGLGMVPRGEVGLIFAAMGKQAGVFGDELFGAMVIMVVMTTLVTPPLLGWSVGRHKGEDDPRPAEPPGESGGESGELTRPLHTEPDRP